MPPLTVVVPVWELVPARVQVLVLVLLIETVLSPLEMGPEITLAEWVPPSPRVLAKLLLPMVTAPGIKRAALVGLRDMVPAPPAARLNDESETTALPLVTLEPASKL